MSLARLLQEFEDRLELPLFLRTSAGRMTPALTEGGIQVSSQTASIQAAIEGRGVALGHGLAVRGDIAAGKLIRLFPKVLCPSEASCYIVYRPEYANLQPLVTFVSWLKNEVLAWQQTA